jgi:hypothetical protein
MKPTRFGLLLLLLSTVLSGFATAQKVDTVTAGGWITGTPSGVRANFGLNARDPAAPSGQVNYLDHGIGMHVKSTSITSYTIVNATTRTITGTCTIDGVAGFTFTVTVTDLGEPGRSDTFAISLSNGYAASGTLRGGNVQLHPV